MEQETPDDGDFSYWESDGTETLETPEREAPAPAAPAAPALRAGPTAHASRKRGASIAAAVVCIVLALALLYGAWKLWPRGDA